MNRKVKRVRTHQSVHVEAIGETGNTLPRTGKTDDLNMTALAEGVLVQMTHVGPKGGGSAEFLIPWGNIVVAVFEPETKKVKSSSGVTPKDFAA